MPTLTESGVPEIHSPTWFAIMAPAKTPAAALARLRQEIGAISASASYGAFLDKQTSEPVTTSPDEGDAFFASERRLWSEAVKAAGATQRTLETCPK